MIIWLIFSQSVEPFFLKKKMKVPLCEKEKKLYDHASFIITLTVQLMVP